MKNFKKGFTLIELLVVIAIISLLASVVLASLSSARAKAADASIQQSLTNLRTQAAIYLQDNNNYGVAGSCNTAGSFFVNPAVQSLVNAAQTTSGQSAVCMSSPTPDDSFPIGLQPPANYWRVYVPLRSVAGSKWCVDNYGNSKQSNGNQPVVFGPCW